MTYSFAGPGILRSPSFDFVPHPSNNENANNAMMDFVFTREKWFRTLYMSSSEGGLHPQSKMLPLANNGL